MKWQAIAGATQQISDEAKIVLKHKLEKDAAVQIPDLWSDFLLGTTKHLQESQSHIEVTTSGKTGGLSCKTQFDPSHSDFLDHDKPFADYIMSRYDQRAAAHLAKAANPITRKFLQHKIGEYKPHLASQIARLEAQLVDGKRHNMAIDATEKIKLATYDNPQTYSSNLQDAVTALSSLALLPLEKKQVLHELLKNENDLQVPVHFYAENRLFNRDVAGHFAAIIPIQKQLFSSASKEEIRELNSELNHSKVLNQWCIAKLTEV